jgi:gluconate 5-dehydrogenase
VRGKIATKGTGNAGYCTTKGAVDMLTKQLASEFGPFGVTVNAIGPNITATPMMTAVFEKRAAEAGISVEAYLKQQGEGNPMRKMGMPEDIVGTAVFLASPASDFMTGNILYPDGGLTAIG